MRSAARCVWPAVVFAAAGALLACQRAHVPNRETALHITAVEIRVHGGAAQRALPAAGELRQWVTAALRRGGAVLNAPHPAATRFAYRLQLELGWVDLGASAGEGAAADPTLGLAVRALASPLRPDQNRPLQGNLALRLPAGPTALAGALRMATRRAVEGAMDELSYQGALLGGSEARLLAALERERGERLGHAVETAAWRRCGAAVPRLMALLRHEDEAVADRAIGALAAIGDRRAVPALTRLARFEETGRLAKLIDAIATLGGAEAHRYLEFVARGHPEPDLAAMAREALARQR